MTTSANKIEVDMMTSYGGDVRKLMLEVLAKSGSKASDFNEYKRFASLSHRIASEEGDKIELTGEEAARMLKVIRDSQFTEVHLQWGI